MLGTAGRGAQPPPAGQGALAYLGDEVTARGTSRPRGALPSLASVTLKAGVCPKGFHRLPGWPSAQRWVLTPDPSLRDRKIPRHKTRLATCLSLFLAGDFLFQRQMGFGPAELCGLRGQGAEAGIVAEGRSWGRDAHLCPGRQGVTVTSDRAPKLRPPPP